jgi:hypothetical protein
MNLELLIPYYGSAKANIENISDEHLTFTEKAFVASTLGVTSALTTIALSSIAGWNSVAMVTTLSNPVTLPLLAVTTAAVIIVPELQEEIIDLSVKSSEKIRLLNPYGLSPY